MATRDESGEGTVGCLIILLLMVIVTYLSFKVIPVYIDSINFDEDLAREASRAGAALWPDEKIRQDVVQMAQFRNFRLDAGDVGIVRSRPSGGELRLDVTYRAAVPFSFYTYVFRFRSRASSIAGALN